MAIAPVNKFISVAVPVSVGKQKLYEVPTGTSALLLYLQVANVGIGATFPKVTFTQQRTQRSTGNKREVRVIKNVEIPPSDAAILVDGRLVLEKTPLIVDKIFIEGTQQQVGIITFVDYDEPTGIVTINTKEPHPFKAGDPITLTGIALTCKAGQTGITTNIFPDPPQSYTVESIEGFVGTSKTFTSHIGGSVPLGVTGKDYSHYYNSAVHYYERSKPLAIEVVSAAGSPTGYIKKSSSAGTTATATASLSNISAGALTGNLTINDGGMGYIASPTVTISGGGGNGGTATVTIVNDVITQITLSGGSGYTSAPTITIAAPEGTTYSPTTGNLSICSPSHGFTDGDSVRLEKESFAFTCALDGNSTAKKYPRNSGQNQNVGKPDYAYGKILRASVENINRIIVFIGTSSDTSIHTYNQANSLANNIHKIGTRYNVTRAVYYGGGSTRNPDQQVVETYDLQNGELVVTTDINHNLSNGDVVRIIDNGIIFSCSMDNRETEHSYPRVTDPASDAELTVTGGAQNNNYNTPKTFVVNVGESYSGGYFAPLEMELIASILENSTG